MPEPKQIKFEHYRHMFMLQFVIYYDIESMLIKNESSGNVDHVPISVCSFTKCSNDKYTTSPVIFTGTNCIQAFLTHLKKEDGKTVDILETEKSRLSCDVDDKKRVKKSHKCEICQKRFSICEKNTGITIT